MLRLRRRKSSKPHMPLTPLIDVIFQLLVFLMLSTRISDIHAFSITLPRLQTQAANDQKEFVPIQIHITQAGDFLLNGDHYSWQTLIEQLESYTHEERQKTFVIAGDQGADYGLFVKLMHQMQKNGMTKITIAYQRDRLNDYE